MKLRLHIEKDRNVSFFCEGWADKVETDDAMKIKIPNAAVAQLILKRMPCKMMLPNQIVLDGNIRKVDEGQCVFL